VFYNNPLSSCNNNQCCINSMSQITITCKLTKIWKATPNVTSSSAVADKPTRRAASWQTAKFQNNHVTITMPLLLVICHPKTIWNYETILYRFQDIIAYFPKIKEVMWQWPRPFQGCHPKAGTSMLNPHTKFEASTIICNKDMKGNAKCKNSRFEPPFGGLSGNTHGSSMAWCKAHCQLPISDNWTLFTSSHVWGTIKRNLPKSAFSEGVSHFECKFYVDGDVACYPSMDILSSIISYPSFSSMAISCQHYTCCEQTTDVAAPSHLKLFNHGCSHYQGSRFSRLWYRTREMTCW